MNEELTNATEQIDEQIEQEPVENTEETPEGATEQVEQTEDTAPSQKTFTQAELDQIIQKRLEREKQKYESDPRIQFVQGLAEMYGLTPEQYIEAVKQQEEQAKLDALIQQNIPQDVAQEILESRKFREQWEAEQAQKQQEELQRMEFMDFFQNYPDVKPEEIPQEVWERNTQGVPLKYAYMEYEHKNLKDRLGKLEKNNSNSQSTAGSVTGQGAPEGAFFTREQVEKMSVAEVNRHWKAITESMKRW
jgi:hypothetical protein